MADAMAHRVGREDMNVAKGVRVGLGDVACLEEGCRGDWEKKWDSLNRIIYHNK